MFSSIGVLSQISRSWRFTQARSLFPSPSRQFPLIRNFRPTQARTFYPSPAPSMTLNQTMRRKKPKRTKFPNSPLLNGAPQRKGVCSQFLIGKPKKPNSAKRKIARVKLSTGKTVTAYIQGEGHNLQEHSVVLVRGGRAQDLPGVRYVECINHGCPHAIVTLSSRYKIVRGALDLGGVVNRQTARSRYGGKSPR